MFMLLLILIFMYFIRVFRRPTCLPVLFYVAVSIIIGFRASAHKVEPFAKSGESRLYNAIFKKLCHYLLLLLLLSRG